MNIISLRSVESTKNYCYFFTSVQPVLPQLYENDDSGVAVKSYSAIGKVFKYLPSLSSADAKY